MDAATIDAVRLNFNEAGIFVINIAIGVLMFGVCLDISLKDFKRIIKSPRAPLIGLLTQFIILPAFTFLLVFLLDPVPSIALGMILVASCPGGNLSNVMTFLAGGNCAVSVSMTAVSTAAAIFMTPLNLSIWGNMNPATREIMHSISISPKEIFLTIFCILGIPMILGMTISYRFPKTARKLKKIFKVSSLIFFFIIAGGALFLNFSIFLDFVGCVLLAVFLHNGLALLLGYQAGALFGLPREDRIAVCIEVGIQNSALGLVLVFTFFNGLGGMAIIAAWWGIWHIISGLFMAMFFSRKKFFKRRIKIKTWV